MEKKHQVEFTLKGLPPMTNELVRSGWRKKMGIVRKWRELTELTLKAQRASLDPEFVNRWPFKHDRVKIYFVRYSSKQPDFDGLVSGCKFLLDGLVSGGLLVDDKGIVPDYRWELCGTKDGRVTIKVVEA